MMMTTIWLLLVNPYHTVDIFYDALEYVPYDDMDFEVPNGLLDE